MSTDPIRKAAIAIDKWKLEIFQKHLDAAKHSYRISRGLSPGTLLILVPYYDNELGDLTALIHAAQKECANDRLRR